MQQLLFVTNVICSPFIQQQVAHAKMISCYIKSHALITRKDHAHNYVKNCNSALTNLAKQLFLLH